METNPHQAANAYIADFEALAKELAGEPDAIRNLRQRAIARFSALGFPTMRQEDWRFTNVAPIAATRFARPAPAPDGVSLADLGHVDLPGTQRLVFINGQLAAELSETAALPPGAMVTSLSRALAEVPDRVLPHLGQHAAFEDQPFAALNTAFMRDGAFVHIPRDAVLEVPVHLLFIGRASAGPTIGQPRNLIVADGGSQATVIEHYAGLGDSAYFTCAVTEVVTGPNAGLDHYKLQAEGASAYHMATMALHMGRDSRFSSHSISTGGALVRHDVDAALAAEGVECILNGLYVVNARQLVDNHMLVRHQKPRGNSHELYKGILDDHARAVFNGRIHVYPDAQKTDAKQSNRNLLLSNDALVNSNPQLEILADDVRCTHGSTVGQLDEEAIFYLRARGLDAALARSLLVYAFASEIIEGIRVDAVHSRLAAFLLGRLPSGDDVRSML